MTIRNRVLCYCIYKIRINVNAQFVMVPWNPCLENTENDTCKRNDVLWGDVTLVQHKAKKTKRIEESLWSTVWVYSANCLFFQQSLSILEVVSQVNYLEATLVSHKSWRTWKILIMSEVFQSLFFIQKQKYFVSVFLTLSVSFMISRDRFYFTVFYFFVCGRQRPSVGDLT